MILRIALLTMIFSSCTTVDKKPYTVISHNGEFLRVQFNIYYRECSNILLIGEFNNWNIKTNLPAYPNDTQYLSNAIIPMKNFEDGWWMVIIPLRPARYEYSYFVDNCSFFPDKRVKTVHNFGINSVIDLTKYQLYH